MNYLPETKKSPNPEGLEDFCQGKLFYRVVLVLSDRVDSTDDSIGVVFGIGRVCPNVPSGTHHSRSCHH